MKTASKSRQATVLKHTRTDLGMTQREFGSRMLGVSHITVCDWENDKRPIPDYVWDVISCALMRSVGVKLSYDHLRQTAPYIPVDGGTL